MVSMRRLWVLMAMAVAAAASAPAQITTVQQLVTFVKSSIQLHQNDLEVANYLRTIKLKEHLEDRTVEELQGAGGLGPKTIAALRILVERSAGLPVAAPPPVQPVRAVRTGPPSPDSITQAQMIAARSEEHTSELQSPDHLVCRLLLEKKKPDRP